MKSVLPRPPGFLRTLLLLLGAARKRADGRRKRQRELLQQRAGRNSFDWDALGFALSVIFMAVVNIGGAFVVRNAVAAAQRIEVERQGKIVVSRLFFDKVKTAETVPLGVLTPDQALDSFNYSYEARRISDKYGGRQATIAQTLRDEMRNHGARNFIADDDPSLELTALAKLGLLPTMLGSIFLIWWGVMLVFQGEGLELDLQRRRHPMWEWLFSHPAPSGAIFLAEMLSPIAANPIYWSAPLFVGCLYSFVYGGETVFLSTLFIGIPVTIAAACLGKALEIGVILRFSPRSRGAMIGIMSWMGYASLLVFLVSLFSIAKIVTAIWKFLDLFTVLPWPWLKLFLGVRPDGSFSFLSGMLTCWIVAGITIAGAVWFSIWGAQKGLSGNVSRADSGPSIPRTGATRFGRNPLYKKEFLWFIRDRSAIVQTILIPLTVAGYQIFNLRTLLSHAQGAWNYLCGAGILFGTYFLWILGPKSLSSEGTALWIALTWPRGLESLLKAKAWLWSLISSGMVALVLCYAAFLYPANILQIALVGAGWFLFGHSMAEKSVTLVTVPSSSGEPQKISRGRQWGASLGMLTFAIGVLTQQWHVAMMGIVYSYITAAAMWENFRARLPYLYDPWSERVPPPPTLMHAMIAISILVEVGAIFTGILIAFAGPENIAIAQAIGYAFCAMGVSIGLWSFLSDRGVSLKDVWQWPTNPRTEGESRASQVLSNTSRIDGSRVGTFLRLFLIGATGGVLLGVFAHVYLAFLQHFPAIAEILRKSQEQLARIPNLRVSYAITAVVFAPFAEEYLFRGLLFRALDREWGGWRAVIGSAAFFAVYHPPLAWAPVSLLGIANALVFKKTGRLAPAVLLHMVYNAVGLLP
jgi:membrane protease YdiL (CAAX protease family)